MPMFYAAWLDERPGFLCEALTLEAATEIATEEGGDPPAGVRMMLPCTFGARVHFTIDEEDADGGEVIEVEPMQHVVDNLGALDDQIQEAVTAAPALVPSLALVPSPALVPPLAVIERNREAAKGATCSATATDPKTGEAVTCAKPADGHGLGEHRAGKLGW